MSGTKIAVVGAGSWGTALAGLLAKKGHSVTLWCFEPDLVDLIRETSENQRYLPGISLPEELMVSSDLGATVHDSDYIISVSPSQFVHKVMSEVADRIPDQAVIVSASKGIELSTLRRMDEVFDSFLSSRQMEGFTVLSGPSFAREVAQESPTAVVAASRSPEAARRVQDLFQMPYFRVYTNPDVIGVELGGALKNVIAVAAGVGAGLELGHNTLAALITRGLAEIKRLGVAMGAQPATFSGLAGMGDLVLTCTGDLSRNRTVGFRLGKGESLASILGDMTAVAEGVQTTESVRDLAERYGVEMPISEQVYGMLVQGKRPDEALRALMERAPKPEEWS